MKPILIIDPGHGGSDPGAIGNGIVEKEMNLKISLYQYERFKQLGVPVAITRTSDTFLDSTPRANLVKASGAKYCISNHINAGGGQGVETIYSIYTKNTLAKKLASAIVSEGQWFRRVFERSYVSSTNGLTYDYYYMHRETGIVETVIVEYGFVDHAADAERVKTNWKKYAEAVVRAFCEFIGHPYKTEGEYSMNKDDANKIIRYLSASWFIVQGNKDAEKEINRLANELRKASGQEPQ